MHIYVQFSSVQSLSHFRLFVTPWAAARQASLSITGAYKNSCPSVGDAIQSSHPVIPFYSRLQSFPAAGPFQMSQFFTSGAKGLEFQLQYQSFQ